MPNPQQPEVRRSERVPALTPDASETELSAQGDTTRGRVGSTPGFDPDTVDAPDQDKPDLDDMADALGVRPDEEA